MKKRPAPPSTPASGSASAVVTGVRATQLIESVRTYLASAAAVVEEKAGIIEEHDTHAREEPDLGGCCHLVQWALVATGKALELESVPLCRTNNDRCEIAAMCREQRQHLLWCRACLDAICRLLQTGSVASQTLDNEARALAALIPDLDQSILLLDPAVLRLPPAGS